MTYSASLDLIDLHLLPKNWGVLQLDEVAFVNETTSNLKEFSWINYTDISSVGTHTVDKPSRLEVKDAPSRARRFLKKGDTVISSVRPNRKSFFYYDGAWSNAIASTGFAVVSPKDAEDAEFLHAILTSDKAVKIYEAICEGGAYPAFNPNRLNELRIPWPSKPVRKALGQLVMNLQIKITINNSISKTLEDIAQTIFKSWFIDFDPVNAKMNGEKPIGMDDETAELFPDSFEESELGLIPKGWEILSLIDLVDSINDGDWIESKDQSESGYRLLQIGNIGLGRFVESGKKKYVSQETFSRLRCTEIKVGDVLIARMPHPTGRSWYVDSLNEPSITSVDVAIVSASESKHSNRYVNLFLNLPSTLNLMESLQTGSTRQRVKRTYIEGLRTIYPGLEVLSKFDEITSGLFKLSDSLKNESNFILKVRDSLLPRLISGELQIPEEMLAS